MPTHGAGGATPRVSPTKSVPTTARPHTPTPADGQRWLLQEWTRGHIRRPAGRVQGSGALGTAGPNQTTQLGDLSLSNSVIVTTVGKGCGMLQPEGDMGTWQPGYP